MKHKLIGVGVIYIIAALLNSNYDPMLWTNLTKGIVCFIILCIVFD